MKRLQSLEVVQALNYVSSASALLCTQIQKGTIKPECVIEETNRINAQLGVVRDAVSDDAFEQAGG